MVNIERTYIKTCINFLNNTKGYGDNYELEFLAEMCGFNKDLTRKNINKLNDYIACDKSDEFIEYLENLKKEGKESE